MKKSTFFALAITVVFSASAMAQDYQFAGFRDVESAFASQQTEMAQLRARLASFEDGIGDTFAIPCNSFYLRGTCELVWN